MNIETTMKQNLTQNEIYDLIGWMASPEPNVLWKKEGYDHVTKTFGCRAGPECSIENIFHEFAHAIVCVIDGESERLNVRGYGLQLPYRQILGHTVVEPRTSQITFLECRVFGIQKALMDSANIDSETDNYFSYCAKVCDYLPDYIFYTPKKLRKRGYSFDAARHRRLSAIIFKEYCKAQEQFDLIKSAWYDACDFIKENQ